MLYHRVAELDSDPWQLAVSPANFESHLQLLRRKYKVISVRELIANLRKKSIPRRTVCITFDDGYCDNYATARPILEKYNCPATFFVATKYVDLQRSFWWSELEQIILKSERLPKLFSLNILGEPLLFDLENDFELTATLKEKQKDWFWSAAPPTRRCELYLKLCRRLRPLKFSEQQSLLENVRNWGNCNSDVSRSISMTSEQIKEMSEKSIFDFGLHTLTHTNLPDHSRETQYEEIAGSEQYLTDNCSKVLRVLAYPNGQFDQTTVSIVKEQQLEGVFTTGAHAVTRFSDPFLLGRFQVNNWNGDDFNKQLSAWMKASWNPEATYATPSNS